MLRFSCPQCGKPLHVEDCDAGKVGKCPKCQASIRAPLLSGKGTEEHSSSGKSEYHDQLAIELARQGACETPGLLDELEFEVYNDGKFWCARGIGEDVFTQAKSLDVLMKNIEEAVEIHSEGKDLVCPEK